MIANVLKKHNAFIFRVKQSKTLTQKMKASLLFGTLEDTRSTTTQHHIPEPDLQGCIDFSVWTYELTCFVLHSRCAVI
jgi:hypothetical protein